MSYDKLTIIPKNEWSLLRDLHLPDWPSNVTAYYAIDSYINWCELNSELGQAVRFYSLNDDWQDGTFLIVVNSYKIISVYIPKVN